MVLREALGYLAPGLLAGWLRRRAMLAHAERLYEAAAPSQWRKPYGANQTSGDGVMVATGSKLREIARHLDENHDLTIAILDDLVNGAVGTGVKIAPMVRKGEELDSDLNQRISEAWEEWCQRPEVTGELSFAQCERLVARTMLRDGEIFVQHMEKPVGYNFPTATRYAIELLEADMVPMEFNDPGRNILQGVECNDWNQPIAYHLWRNHPGDPLRQAAPRADELKRLVADQVMHPKFSRRIRQRRGVTVLHGVINRIRDLKDYEESERIAAKVAADFTWYIKKTQEYNPAGAETNSATGARNLVMTGGMGFELLPGEEVGTIHSDRPNTQLVPFREGMLRAVAGGTGARFSSIARNYNGTYSSQRQELVEATIAYQALFDHLVSAFHRPTYQRWVVAAAMAGVFGRLKSEDARLIANLVRAEYRPPTLPWIDPAKEADGYKTLIEIGVESRSEIMRKRGRDPEKVWQELQEEKDSGLFEQPKPKAAAPATPDTSTSDPQPGPSDVAAAA